MIYFKDKILFCSKNRKLSSILDKAFILEFSDQYLDDLSLIVLDINDVELFDKLTKYQKCCDLAIVLYVDKVDEYLITRAYECGIADLIKDDECEFEINLKLQSIIKQSKLNRELKNNNQHLNNDEHNLIEMMEKMMIEMFRYHQLDSAKHMANLKEITYVLLKEYQLDHQEISDHWIDIVSVGASYHDIGKIGISDDLINAKYKLSNEEYEIVKEHTIIGEKIFYSMLNSFDNELIYEWMAICRWHHERIDGKGYPDGLTKELIPLSAQIVGIADAYEALTSKRSYKKALNFDEALKLIKMGKCGAFEPELIEILSRCRNKLIYIEYQRDM